MSTQHTLPIAAAVSATSAATRAISSMGVEGLWSVSIGGSTLEALAETLTGDTPWAGIMLFWLPMLSVTVFWVSLMTASNHKLAIWWLTNETIFIYNPIITVANPEFVLVILAWPCLYDALKDVSAIISPRALHFDRTPFWLRKRPGKKDRRRNSRFLETNCTSNRRIGHGDVAVDHALG
jgi:hypothetical protein